MALDTYDTGDNEATADSAAVDPNSAKDGEQTPAEAQLVKEIRKKVKADKAFFAEDFKRMREDMFIARYGHAPDYPKHHYKANLAGRHVKQKTAALYAKNPRIVARRRESLDFTVWDEDPKTLEMAFGTIQAGKQALAQAQNPTDPVTGAPMPPQMDPATGQPRRPEVPPELEQALQTAQATIADYQQGMQKRQMMTRVGKTLQLVFAYQLDEQQPVQFKTGMKQAVRRATVAGVAYAELGFQREYGPRPGLTDQMNDIRTRLEHLRVLASNLSDEENPVQPDDPEIAELQNALEALQAEEEVLTREGLIIDFPQATRVIPDKLCRNLTGFVGSRHLTIEYLYTCEQVKEIFGADLGKEYQGYVKDMKNPASDGEDKDALPDATSYSPTRKGQGLVCVWKTYDLSSGLVYYTADGYAKFLKKPAAPDVFVENFWPVYALTFNEIENEDHIFPLSDVRLMADQQADWNRSRQGKREHRKAARPRWFHRDGALEDGDVAAIAKAEALTSTGVKTDQKLKDIFDTLPVPGVDPNLYDTGEIFTDIQYATGSSESQFGVTGSATATGESIAANSSKSSDDSSIDDLDAFLTAVARGGGQILFREMSEEQVKAIVGVGAVWPQMSLNEIAEEIYLEVEAGSTGKPNQAVEINNWKNMLPFLLQMPGISHDWLARETVRRLDDNADLTEALSKDIPSIVARNGLATAQTGNPATEPTQQGAAGAQNAPQPHSRTEGTGPAFGDNKTP
jgi:hypothetical protein